jgi:hypothetical protein
LVEIAPSTQQITAHAGLVLVRELWEVLGIGELLDRITVKKRRRGYGPSQQLLALCETLIAGGECLDDAAMLRADGCQERLRGHAVPDPTTLGRFLRRFNLGHIRQLNAALDGLFVRVHPLLERERLTLDLDATLVEHHGPPGSRQGTRGTYTGKVAWHPLLCFVAETGTHVRARPSAIGAQRRPTTVYGLQDWLDRDAAGTMSGGRIEQSGAGGRTLCSRCNNNTGSWYGNELARAVRAAARILADVPLDHFDELTEHRWARVGIAQSATGPYPLRFIRAPVAAAGNERRQGDLRQRTQLLLNAGPTPMVTRGREGPCAGAMSRPPRPSLASCSRSTIRA